MRIILIEFIVLVLVKTTVVSQTTVVLYGQKTLCYKVEGQTKSVIGTPAALAALKPPFTSTRL